MNRKLKLTELGRLSRPEFREAEKSPILVILDNIRSLHNVGAVFRTADAFRIKHVYLCGITPIPPHRDIRKTALGAEDAVDWSYHDTAMSVVQQLKRDGVKVLAVEQAEKTVMLDDFEAADDAVYAVVFGNEVEGVDQHVVSEADAVLEVPQIGTKHSLNVSVCAGVVLWELFKAVR